jgi:hypothetical protein
MSPKLKKCSGAEIRLTKNQTFKPFFVILLNKKSAVLSLLTGNSKFHKISANPYLCVLPCAKLHSICGKLGNLWGKRGEYMGKNWAKDKNYKFPQPTANPDFCRSS